MISDGPPRGISVSYLRNLIIKCSLIFIGGILLTTVVFFLTVHQPPASSYQESFRVLSQLKQEILAKSIIIYAFAVILIVAGIVFITLMYSHRVVGPMRRISSIAGKISDGDFSETITLRGKDAIQPLADELNDFIAEYRGKVTALKSQVEDLIGDTSLNESAESGGGLGTTDQFAGKVKELEKIVDRIKL